MKKTRVQKILVDICWFIVVIVVVAAIHTSKFKYKVLAIFQGGIFPGENVKAIKSENTIGRFYNHILNALGYLTNCGKDSSIFTGNPSKQVNFDGWSVQGKTIKVTDYQSSIAAIQAIVEQGEGSSPCNPDSWFSRKLQLSHYYLFYSIAEKREIKVFHTNSTGSSEVCLWLRTFFSHGTAKADGLMWLLICFSMTPLW